MGLYSDMGTVVWVHNTHAVRIYVCCLPPVAWPALQTLTRFKEDNKIQGFSKVIVAEKTVDGISSV